MRIVFWQNIVSPHQMPYIVHLPEMEDVGEVVLVVPREQEEERLQMGWSCGQQDANGGVRLVVAPSDEQARLLFERCRDKSWHIFSGISAFPEVLRWLKLSLEVKLRRAVISEAPNTYDFERNLPGVKPLWLHHCRFAIEDRRYARKVSAVFAIGETAASYFASCGAWWRVHRFCYCTESVAVAHLALEGPMSFVFVGSMVKWKGVRSIIEALRRVDQSHKGDECSFRFVGDGPERADIEKMICKYGLEGRVNILGVRPMAEIPSLIVGCDVLVLPSLYDGWGAVVNEALQNGLFVLVSEAAGASTLLRADERLGLSFRPNGGSNLAKAISRCLDMREAIRGNCEWRRDWAERNISGRVIAARMYHDLMSDMSDFDMR